MQSTPELGSSGNVGKRSLILAEKELLMELSSCYCLTININFILFQHQLTLELLGFDNKSRSLFPNGVTEDACFVQCKIKNDIASCRFIYLKKKYGAFFTGDFDLAAEMCELCRRDFPVGSGGTSVSFPFSMPGVV